MNEKQKDFIIRVFKRMLAEQDNDYAFKDEVVRNYINLIIHEAVKMQPSLDQSKKTNVLERVTAVFLELLGTPVCY